MASVLAEGKTILDNCAIEPEIMDLVHFLNSMGAKIKKIENRTFEILGVEELFPTQYTIIPDRIEVFCFF